MEKKPNLLIEKLSLTSKYVQSAEVHWEIKKVFNFKLSTLENILEDFN